MANARRMSAEDGPGQPLLEARNLTKRYGKRPVLQGVSLTLAPGDCVAVLGPSGAGKTTLFRCLTRLVEPDSGEIYLEGQALHGLRGRALAQARQHLGVVFQQFNLVRRLSALDNAVAGRLAHVPFWRVALAAYQDADLARAAQALEAVGLSDHLHQRADTLSGGQQQRVAIARALTQEARVILADEPVASLDPETAAAILSLLRKLAEAQGLAILCTLHQPDLAHRYMTRTLHMTDGRFV